MKRLGHIFLFLAFASSVYCSPTAMDPTLAPTPKPKEETPSSPWLTGPLLTPSGHIVPLGFINVEPFFFYTTTNGIYDNNWNSSSITNLYSALFQFPAFFGLSEWADILFVGQAAWNKTRGVSTLNFGDFIVELDFALLQDTATNHIPGFKLYIQEVFPTGRYENLDPQNFGTDIGGKGSFKTTLGFVITRTFHLWCENFLALRFNGFYVAPSPVKVKGINAYGGAPDTDGKVRPGPCFGGLLGIEYNLTRNWALALDVQGLYGETTKFTGRRGTLADGSPGIGLDLPVSFQFTLAPAIEYNFSESFGMIGGCWFSLAGKNSARFISGVIAINYFGPLPKTPGHTFRTSGGGTSPSTGGGGFGGGF